MFVKTKTWDELKKLSEVTNEILTTDEDREDVFLESMYSPDNIFEVEPERIFDYKGSYTGRHYRNWFVGAPNEDSVKFEYHRSWLVQTDRKGNRV